MDWGIVGYVLIGGMLIFAARFNCFMYEVLVFEEPRRLLGRPTKLIVSFIFLLTGALAVGYGAPWWLVLLMAFTFLMALTIVAYMIARAITQSRKFFSRSGSASS